MKKIAETNTLTIELMIKLYCRDMHETDEEVCEDCLELNEYCIARLHACRYGAKKGPCSKCSTNCFNKEMREKIKGVMTYAGPRMLREHPLITLQHSASLLKHALLKRIKVVTNIFK